MITDYRVYTVLCLLLWSVLLSHMYVVSVKSSLGPGRICKWNLLSLFLFPDILFGCSLVAFLCVFVYSTAVLMWQCWACIQASSMFFFFFLAGPTRTSGHFFFVTLSELYISVAEAANQCFCVLSCCSDVCIRAVSAVSWSSSWRLDRSCCLCGASQQAALRERSM